MGCLNASNPLTSKADDIQCSATEPGQNINSRGYISRQLVHLGLPSIAKLRGLVKEYAGELADLGGAEGRIHYAALGAMCLPFGNEDTLAKYAAKLAPSKRRLLIVRGVGEDMIDGSGVRGVETVLLVIWSA